MVLPTAKYHPCQASSLALITHARASYYCILDHLKYQYLRLSISTNIRPWIRVDPAPAVEYTGELYIKVYQAAIVLD